MKKFIIGIALVLTPFLNNTATATELTDFQVTNRMVEFLEASKEMMDLAVQLEAAKLRYANAKIGYEEIKTDSDMRGKISRSLKKDGPVAIKDYNKLAAAHRESLAEYKVYKTRKQVASN